MNSEHKITDMLALGEDVPKLWFQNFCPNFSATDATMYVLIYRQICGSLDTKNVCELIQVDWHIYASDNYANHWFE